MATEQTQKLQAELWNIANTLRKQMDADDFRDYNKLKNVYETTYIN
jgi:type I restriction-modification system DNA methylase subunit